ncbi:HAMP domain-containing protein [Actinospica sp. MGRD01-02]|uniref:histidine kinase n=1 Tax=Actinospica acidithermotolerans TaxID=2828514 RepID=A0A941EC89_9ACTN|nr:ATP-binding protein [Actinospica acidithermotolerans]MBR7826374.1 HAMP domain-containing protein [Actinospica acidithermotolerans]
MPLRTPRNTIRLRLTLLYAAFFLFSGAVLVAIIYTLVDSSSGPLVSVTHLNPVPLGSGGAVHTEPPQPLQSSLAQAAHAQEMHELLVNSMVALPVMAVVSALLGWIVAGRVLRPLRVITGSVRDITAHRLNERLLVSGPRDELAELSETFNGLLDRLEAAFEAERLFVANASHELRTPLTRERTVMEVALRDRNATVETLRAAGERVLASGQQLEKLIEALLTLARSQREVEADEPFDLAEAAAKYVATTESAARVASVTVHADLAPAPGRGDPRLAERLVANLVDNAIRHNVPGGHVTVRTWQADGSSHVRVENTGQLVPATELHRLTHPFQRLAPGRGSGSGSGLGLSIVRAIAAAHGAKCMLASRPGGGLVVEVRFRTPRGPRPGDGSGAARGNGHQPAVPPKADSNSSMSS